VAGRIVGGDWIKIFEPALSFEDERHFCCYLPGTHEHAHLIKINSNTRPATTNFKDHVSTTC
jgi:hypothetical protein